MKATLAPSPTNAVSVSLLGNFGLERSGVRLTDDINRSQKLWSVLAYLLLHRDRPVLQAELIERFWPDEEKANPANALKTLLYRIRSMLAPLFGPDVNPILAQRGAYYWNPAIPCQVDIDRFEALCHQAAAPNLSPDGRLALYRLALPLYKGNLLPKLETQLWVITLSVRYRTLYRDAVCACADLLDRSGRYEEMTALCAAAIELEPLDEGLHVLMLRGLLRQGQDGAALAHYDKVTELLYQNLGVRPSRELRALYGEIMRTEQDMETDLELIQQDLQETVARSGAFVCEYGFFREAYRLEARRAQRSGASVHIALITLSLPSGGVPPLKVLSNTMDQLLAVVTASLRRGDVVSKFSGAQYVIMLPWANLEDSTAVVERMVAAFLQQYHRNYLKITYKIRELGPC